MDMTQFDCSLEQPGVPLPHVWSHTIGSGRAHLALRADWQAQMRKVRAELGCRHVRFHAILSDDMGTVLVEQGELLYGFHNADSRRAAGRHRVRDARLRAMTMSQQIGERVLLPAVRNAGAGTLVIADGFSCREQISQGCGRKTLHLAEVLRLAIRQRTPPAADARPAPAPRRKNIGEYT